MSGAATGGQRSLWGRKNSTQLRPKTVQNEKLAFGLQTPPHQRSMPTRSTDVPNHLFHDSPLIFPVRSSRHGNRRLSFRMASAPLDRTNLWLPSVVTVVTAIYECGPFMPLQRLRFPSVPLGRFQPFRCALPFCCLFQLLHIYNYFVPHEFELLEYTWFLSRSLEVGVLSGPTICFWMVSSTKSEVIFIVYWQFSPCQLRSLHHWQCCALLVSACNQNYYIIITMGNESSLLSLVCVKVIGFANIKMETPLSRTKMMTSCCFPIFSEKAHVSLV